MARIELRHCTIRLLDGLSGSANINQAGMPPQTGDTTLTINTVVLNTDVTNRVPLGARFTVANEADSPVHVVTARTPSSGEPTTALTFSPAIGPSSIMGVTGAATTTTPGSGADDEVQQIAQYGNTVVAGTFTLTLTLDGDSPVITAPINYNANAATIQSAINVAVSAHAGWTNGDIVVTGGPLTSGAITLTFSGTSVALTDHGQTTINGSNLVAQLSGTAVLTFQPQQLDIKIGDGDLNYTETTEYLYDLDRGNLDTVREGNEVPMEISLNFTYEHITTGTGETIAPMDAIKRKGGASEWVSSATDKCEPYAVDLQVIHEPPCGTASAETTTFPDFRSEKREPNFKDSNISITGKCNAVEPIVTRS